MIERRMMVIANVERDYSRDVVELWGADGCGYYLTRLSLQRAAEQAFGDNSVVSLIGLTAIFELVDGRWLLARIAVKT
jgi:hypothetical protein